MLACTRITIRRRGEITFRVRGANHCGAQGSVQAGTINARWTVTAECAPTLDEHGFLFDQTALDGLVAVVTAADVYQSCEHVAKDVGKYFLHWLAKNVPTCGIRTLSVVLSPAPYAAELTVHYTQPDTGKDFP